MELVTSAESARVDREAAGNVDSACAGALLLRQFTRGKVSLEKKGLSMSLDCSQ
jgi:hypothetical protein